MSLLINTLTTAALLIAWCGLLTGSPIEGHFLPAIVLAVLSVVQVGELIGAAHSAANRRLADGRWWGLDAAVRHVGTPVVLGGGLALAIWALVRASAGAKLGGYGSLLVLLVFVAMIAKLAAETYLFAQLGGEPSPRQASARALIGPWSFWSKLRYFLGAMGGVILPLGAQLLAGGAKNIPAVVDAGPPAVMAAAALVCLVPGELIERWLFWKPGAAT